MHNNNDMVPTLEAMKKKIYYFHKKGVDILKLDFTLQNVANFFSIALKLPVFNLARKEIQIKTYLMELQLFLLWKVCLVVQEFALAQL